jgi:co-chaperonin GroES (HSP10)
LLKPIKNNVVLELIDKEKVTSSGIVLPSADPVEANKGKVVSLGPDVEMVKEGDMVLPNWNAARQIKYNEFEYYVVSEDDIVLIFEE